MAKEEQQATFAVNLEGNIEGNAESAAKAVDTLRDAIERDTKALRELENGMKRLKGGSSTNIAQFRTLKAQIDAKKNAIAEAQGALVDLGATLERTRKPGSGFGKMLDQMRQQAQGVGGPLGTVAGRLGSMKSLLAGGVIALGIVAIAAGLAVLAAAAVTAGAALLRYGVAQANARRAELLRLEGLTKMRSIWGLAAGNATEMQRAIDRTSGSVALQREEIAGLATELYRAGLRGQNFDDALEATAIKAATQGQAAAKQWADLAAGIALSGGSVRKMAQDVKARLGGIAAAQMLDLNVQAQKLRENFGALFADLKVEGLLKALKTVTDLFSQSTVSGRALHSLVKVVFQPLIDAIEHVAPLAKRFFQGMVLGAQHLAISVLRVALYFKRTFGSSFLKDMDLSTSALRAGKLAVYLLIAGFAGLSVVVGVFALAVGALIAPFIAFAGILYASFTIARLFWTTVYKVGSVAITYLSKALGEAYDFVAGIDWIELGKSICNGIVRGVKGGARWVIEALSTLGSDAWRSFKETLGIASPSKEFAKLGRALPQGVAAGVDDATPSLDRTVSEMVEPPDVSRAAVGNGSPTVGAAHVSVSIAQLTLQTSETTSRGIAGDLRQQLEEVLSGLLVQVGGARP